MTSKISIGANFDLSAFSKNTIDEATKIAMYNLSETAIEEAYNNAPYETSKLRQSIDKTPQNISKITKKVIVGPRRVPYAERREFENFKNPHRKFYMKKAHKTTNQESGKEFNTALKIAFKRKNVQI